MQETFLEKRKCESYKWRNQGAVLLRENKIFKSSWLPSTDAQLALEGWADHTLTLQLLWVTHRVRLLLRHVGMQVFICFFLLSCSRQSKTVAKTLKSRRSARFHSKFEDEIFLIKKNTL